MKSSSASKIKINSFNDLFGADSREKSIKMITLDKLHPFKNHPFKVLDNEEMEELV
ncbi:MAG: chromosome partitioning protein ParB, partial [Clostridia bacterium]|nr:chromosome partitioning protein ParB [Clostridia bacterium]